MRKSKQFVSLPVISTKEGKQIGTIKKLVIDPISKQVVALVLDRKKASEDGVLLYRDIRSVGNEAITIDSEDKVKDLSSHPEILTLLKSEVGLVGSKILIENGILVGNVQDYWIEKSSGRILFIDFSNGFFKTLFRGIGRLEVTHIRTIGQEIVIVKEGTEEEVIDTSKFKFKNN